MLKYTKSQQLQSRGSAFKPKKKRKTTTERSQLIKKLDNEIRRILKKEVECFTCGSLREEIGSYGVDGNRYGLQVGHYVSRKVYALRWNLKNCQSQCTYCNGRHRFDQLDYTEAMALKHGKHIFTELKELRKTKITTVMMRDILQALKEQHE